MKYLISMRMLTNLSDHGLSDLVEEKIRQYY